MASYVYILINPSLNGLLKIGTTNRSPDQRAAELSNSTNMPNPFIVAYEQVVSDGYLAEKIIHEELAKAGYRVNDSREFFSIPLKQAIQLVSSVAEILCDTEDDSSGLLDVGRQPGLSGDYYFQKALKESSGDCDTLQDHSAALESFQRATDLGCVKAYFFMAHIYIQGLGVRQSSKKAISLLKIGGEKGDASCLQQLWSIYAGNTILDEKNENNAEVCFKWLIDSAKTRGDDVLIEALLGYLSHSYDRLDSYGEKFPIDKFPGIHFQFAIEMLTRMTREAFQRIRKARLEGKEFGLLENEWRDRGLSTYGLIVQYHMFLFDSVRRPEVVMRKAMAGIERADLEYFLGDGNSVYTSAKGFLPYLTIEPRKTARETDAATSEKKKRGFFSRLFS